MRRWMQRFSNGLLCSDGTSPSAGRTSHAVGDGSQLDISPPTAGLVFVVLLVVSACPLFLHMFASANDFTNHLARVWVTLHYADVAGLRTFFVPYWHFQPDLALDAVVGVLGHFVPVLLAGRFFLALIFALILSGTVLLHRAAFGRWSLWPFLAALLLYNRNLVAGHVNLLFAVGLYLHAVAVWIRLRGRSPILRMAALTAFTITIFLSHLFALGLLGLTLVAYEVWASWDVDVDLGKIAVNITWVVLPFVPAVLMFVFLTPHSHASLGIYYRDLTARVTAFGVPLLYDRWIDGLMVVAIGALVLGLLATGTLRFHWGLAAAAVLLVIVQMVMPNELLTATSVDHRIPIAALLLMIAATDVVSSSRALRFGFVVMLVVLVPLRLWSVNQRWTEDDTIYAAVHAGLVTLPPGSLVASALPPHSFDNTTSRGIAAYFLPAWDVIRGGGFTQTLFAFPTQHPLIMRPEYWALTLALTTGDLWEVFVADPPAARSVGLDASFRASLDRYGYIAFIDNKPFSVQPTDLLTEVYSNTYVRIYRVEHSRL